MAKPTSQERRKRILKERRAQESREQGRLEADALFQEALRAHAEGDIPGADRLAKKALIQDPEHADALGLLVEIHDSAGHYAEALAYLRRQRQLGDNPTVIYNLGVIYRKLGEAENAARSMREFLAATRTLSEPKWRELREAAEMVCRQSPLRPQPVKPAPTATRPSAVMPEVKQPDPAPTPPEAPRTSVNFLPAATPSFTDSGTLADYLLRGQWIALRLAQNFEDLLCLPSLDGVDAYVYQQETVRRVLRHFKGRALLADEVGLGKTIEACLVLKEYWIRGLVRKALVLAPPSLVSQWKGELVEKFGMAPVAPDTAAFRANPGKFWREEPLVVASIAMARLDAQAAEIAAVSWDMVIVDEAHCLKSRTSANWKLVDSLQKKFILLLSATPVENNLLELYNLITLLKPGLLATEAEFRKKFTTPGNPKAPKNPAQLREMLSDVMIRNTRAAADVQLPRRIAASVAVPASESEGRLYDMVSHFVARRFRKGGPTMALDFLQRQAGSSPVALRRAAGRALEGESWVEAGARRELLAIMELASDLGDSGKGTHLGRMLAGHTGKAVVYTEFIATLDYLRHVCDEHGISYAVFTGDLPRAGKDAAIARFRDDARVLLSTGAGGEGRNLQFADTVINFDLPWSPMRLEQRVGRVHRIGQTRQVFVFNYCQAGTIEEQILRVLHDKINMFELVVGEMDAILGTLDDSRDFAEIVMDLWIAGRESGAVAQGFDALAARLLEAKKQHAQVQALDASLFADDFEV